MKGGRGREEGRGERRNKRVRVTKMRKSTNCHIIP